MAKSIAELKVQGDSAFKRQDFHEAYTAYSLALNASNSDNTAILSSRSLTASKIGKYDVALEDAENAIKGLHLSKGKDERALSKAYYRQIVALVALCDVEKLAGAVQAGLAADGKLKCLRAALLSNSSPFSAQWLAQHWATLITAGEEPLPLSSRDGKLLRIIAPSQCLSPESLRSELAAAIVAYQLGPDCRHMLLTAWQRGGNPSRAPLALVRGYAYLQVQEHEIALRDVKVALAYGSKVDGKPSWAPALALLGSVAEAQADNTTAALAIQTALELRPGELLWRESLERLMRRIPDAHAKALQEGGLKRLEALLRGEEEEATPEFMRQRPKYYYYHEWMRKRIAEHCGGSLPEAVIGRMLAMEAGELDLILHYPSAAQQQANELLEIYDTQGAEFLEASKPPQLTWEQVKSLKGRNLVGLGMGGPAPGEGLTIKQDFGTSRLAIHPPPAAHANVDKIVPTTTAVASSGALDSDLSNSTSIGSVPLHTADDRPNGDVISSPPTDGSQSREEDFATATKGSAGIEDNRAFEKTISSTTIGPKEVGLSEVKASVESSAARRERLKGAASAAVEAAEAAHPEYLKLSVP